jgi:hypothetical protein
MSDAARVLSSPLRDAAAILDAMVERKDELGLSNELVDEIAGFGGSMRWNKYFGPARENEVE